MNKFLTSLVLAIFATSLFAPAAMANAREEQSCRVFAYMSHGLSRRLTAESGQKAVEIAKLRFSSKDGVEINNLQFQTRLKKSLASSAVSNIKLMSGASVVATAELANDGSFAFENINFEAKGINSTLKLVADLSDKFATENVLTVGFKKGEKINAECLASGDDVMVKGPYKLQSTKLVIVPAKKTDSTSSSGANTSTTNSSPNTTTTTTEPTTSTQPTTLTVALTSDSPAGQVAAAAGTTVAKFTLKPVASSQLKKLTFKLVGDHTKLKNLKVVNVNGLVLATSSSVSEDGYVTFSFNKYALAANQSETFAFVAALTTGGKIKLSMQAESDIVIISEEGESLSVFSGLPFASNEVSF